MDCILKKGHGTGLSWVVGIRSSPPFSKTCVMGVCLAQFYCCNGAGLPFGICCPSVSFFPFFFFFFLTNSGIMKQPDVPHRPCWGASYFRLLKNDSATKQSANTEVQREVVSSLPMTECQKRSPGSNFLEIHEWTSLLQKTIVVAGSDPKWALLVYPYFIFLSLGPWWENW